MYTPPIPRTASKLLRKFIVLKFLRIDLEVTSEEFFEFVMYDKIFKVNFFTFENLIIHHKFKKTSKVTSKSIGKNFQTMNFRSDFQAVCGIGGVYCVSLMICMSCCHDVK